ncbi:MAG: hypothetical protein KatS3mg087_0985 [Patescibacteria group bacterium]|nr:MAG: hypothetical protein KatS3mg087_0985 [Patescibacteria group bacterium]
MYWQKPSDQGLKKQKATVQEKIQLGESIPYQEGSIDAYLYQIAIERQPLPNILIVNLIRGPQLGLEGRDLVASLEGQIRATKQKGVRATWLWSYSALQNPQLVELAKSKLADDEHGLFFEIDPDSAAASGVAYRGRSSWYHSGGLFLTSYDVWERTKIIDTYFQKFNSQFNYNPTSVGAWWIGAQPISYLQQKYGVTAVLQCADQFATDAYSLWGTPWSIAYQPSRHNAALPAQDYFDRSKVTIVQWAPRDPLRGYGNSVENSTYSAQDFTYKNYSLDYFTKLKDTYAQKPHDAFVFGLESGFDPEVYQIGLAHQVALANSWRNDNQVNLSTMKNFAAQFRRADLTLADTSSGIFNEYQGTNQSWWYHSPHYRLVVQKIGEQVSIVDLRNYHARIQEEWFNFPNTQSLLRIHTPSIIDSVRQPHHLWPLTQTKESLRIEESDTQTTLFAGTQKLLTASDKHLTVYATDRPPAPQYFRETQANTWTFLPTSDADFNFLPHRLHLAQASQSLSHDINNFLEWFSFRKLHQFYTLSTLLCISLTIYFLRRHRRPFFFLLAASLVYLSGTYLIRTYPIQLTPSEKIALTAIPAETNVAVLVNSQNQSLYKGPQPLLTQDSSLISSMIDRPVQKITFLHYSDLEKQDLPEIILAPRFLMADPPEDLMQQINYQKTLDLGTIAVYQKI